MLKRCSRCGKKRDIEQFNHDSRRNDGRFVWCKECRKGYTKRYRDSIPIEERKRRSAAWRAKVAANATLRRLYSKRFMGYMLKHRYGITTEVMLNMVKQQGGRCAICRSPFRKTKNKSLHVDHDHSTGKVRGILCNSCNCGLGFFGDRAKLLMNAIKYLRRD